MSSVIETKIPRSYGSRPPYREPEIPKFSITFGIVGRDMEVLSPPSGPAGHIVPDALRHDILGLERRSGWNGRGSRAIRRQDCEAAIEFLGLIFRRSRTFPVPRFGPSPKGGVPLTWRLGD